MKKNATSKKGQRRVKLPRNVESEIRVVVSKRAIGISVDHLPSGVVVVKSFHEKTGAKNSNAQKDSTLFPGLCVGDALLSVNSESVEFLTYATLLRKIRSAGRPLLLSFAKWTQEDNDIESGGAGLELKHEVEDSSTYKDAYQVPRQPKLKKVYTSKDLRDNHSLKKAQKYVR